MRKSRHFIPVILCFFTLSTVHAIPNADASKITLEQKTANSEWSYTLALQAASWGAPLVTMYALRYNDAVGPNAKAQPNSIWRMEDISTPELSKTAGYVTPNVNVLYGFGFIDLRNEPIILEVPNSNNRYYMVEIVDMWTNAFAYAGGKTTGYKGGKFALVGPHWKGTLPRDVKRIDCPTPWILLQPRVHIYQNGSIDLEGSKKILEAITTTGLSEYLGNSPLKPAAYSYPEPKVVNPALPVSALSYQDPLQFWELFSNALNENPPPENQIEGLLPLFQPLGIELGKVWDRSKLAPEVLNAMRQASQKIGGLLAHLPIGTFYKGAFIPPVTIGNFKEDFRTRAITARIGLTANTPYEAVYWMYTLDNTAQGLTGNNTFTMTFKKEIPYYEPGFWSLTMYDAENNYTVSNPINRYMLGSDTPLQKNEDGSFTLYIQKESPGKNLESNWLPAPSTRFYLILRSYAPKPETIHILKDPTSWPVPEIMRK